MTGFTKYEVSDLELILWVFAGSQTVVGEFCAETQDSVTKMLGWAFKFETLLARMSGDDPKDIRDLLSAMRAYVSEHARRWPLGSFTSVPSTDDPTWEDFRSEILESTVCCAELIVSHIKRMHDILRSSPRFDIFSAGFGLLAPSFGAKVVNRLEKMNTFLQELDFDADNWNSQESLMFRTVGYLLIGDMTLRLYPRYEVGEVGAPGQLELFGSTVPVTHYPVR